MSKENNRLTTYYKKREQDPGNLKYTYLDVGNLYIIQSRERKFLQILKKIDFKDLKAKKILDVGCGSGNSLRNMVQYGANPCNLFGIDLLPNRVKNAKEISSDIHFNRGDAVTLPYKSNFFDLVTQYTMFTSIISNDIKKKVAQEILRVVKKDGFIIWYDMRITNPADKNVQAVGKKEIRELFQGCSVKFYSVTLNPFISRSLARFSVNMCNLLEKIGILNSHYFAVIKKSTWKG